jgi:colicin import membrane protein
MAKPGVVLRRPVGSDGPFREDADLPRDLSGEPRAKIRAKPTRQVPQPTDDKPARKAALALEREEKRRESERRKEEAAREKERERRQQAVAKAQAALEKAKAEHDMRAGALAAERAAVEKRLQAEEARWENQKGKLESVLRRARG